MDSRGAHIRELVSGDGEPLLAVDFYGLRPEASFSDFFHGSRLGRPVLELVPFGLSGEQIPGPDGPHYARAYVDELLKEGITSCSLIGYCAGGLIAHEIAAQLYAEGCVVRTLILIETVPVSPEDVIAEFDAIVGRTGYLELAVPHRAQAIDALGRAELVVVRAALDRGVDEVVGTALSAAELPSDDPVRIELLLRYKAWLAYVIAASSAARSRFPGDVELIQLADAERPSSWFASGRVVVQRFLAEDRGLLACADVMRAVESIFRTATPGRTRPQLCPSPSDTE